MVSLTRNSPGAPSRRVLTVAVGLVPPLTLATVMVMGGWSLLPWVSPNSMLKMVLLTAETVTSAPIARNAACTVAANAVLFVPV